MKKLILNTLLALITAVVLIGVSVSAIKMKNKALSKESSYSLTDFDYIASSPSDDQVATFKANTEAVANIFACYNFSTNVSGDTSVKINVLMSTNMEDYDVAFFNSDTKLSGSYKEDGICLDKKAASKLGVEVGDSVKVALANRQFELTVSSIYMTSTYEGFNKGLAMAKLTDEMKNLFSTTLTYDMAFIEANDEAACAEMLNGYIPLGPLQSEEDYIEEYKSQNNQPATMTEDEWNASIKVAYEEYKETYLSGDFTNSVQVKSSYMSDIVDQNETTLKKVDQLCIVIAVVMALFTVVSIIFPYIWKNDIEKYARDGSSFVYISNYLWAIVPAAIVLVIALISMISVASTTSFAGSYGGIYAWLVASALISIVVIAIATAVYNKKINSSATRGR